MPSDRRRMAALPVAVALLLGFGGGLPHAAAVEGYYAPVDKPGPRLSVPVEDLRRSLECTENLRQAKQEPVLLVPATAFEPKEQHGWNYMRQFDQLGRPYCTVTTPKFALEDLQISGEYVVHAIRTMYRESGRRIALLGASQGGVLPRWALRFWPDTRAMVADHIGLAPTNRGTPMGLPLGPPGAWSPGVWQQMYGSAWMTALNTGQETFPGIDYTEIYSHADEAVPFFLSPLADDGGRVTNVAVQDVCPGHVAEHVKMGTYDPVGYALATDALTHDGPADLARIDRAVCLQEFPPGVDPTEAVLALAAISVNTAMRFAGAERADREPAPRCYVTDTCPSPKP